MATAVENLLVRIDATTEQLRREMKRADDTVRSSQQKIDRSLQQIDTGFDRLGKGISGATRLLGLFGVALSVGAITGFTRSTIEAADALAKTADKLGVTIEALQEFRFAAERSGVEANTLDMAMQRFVRRLGEAQAGTGELLPIIKEYGIALRNANGQARSAEEVLADYADAVAAAGSQQEKLRLAFKAFDSEGAALVNLLRRGASGLEELRQQARDAGAVLDADFGRKAERLNDRLGVLDDRMNVATTTLLLSLEPALVSVLDVYERFSIGTASLINQFAAVSELGLGPLEKRAESLREKIKLLEQTNPGDWFGTLSGAKADLAEVEAQIEAIRTGGIQPNSGGPLDVLLPPDKLAATNDNLDDLRAKLFAAGGAMEQFGMGGRDALSAFDQHAELVRRAEALAESFNKTNAKAIDSGKVLARTGEDYLPILEDLAALDERRADALRLDDYIEKISEEQRYARDRLKLGEDQAAIEREINRLKADGLILNEATEERIRGTLAQTKDLNDAWEEQERAIKDAAKAAEAAERQAEIYNEVWLNAVEDIQRTMTDSIEDALAGNIRSFDDFADEVMGIVRRLAANLISQAIVVPITTSVAGSLGISVPGGQAANDNGGPLGGFNPISAIGNRIVGNIADRFLPTIGTGSGSGFINPGSIIGRVGTAFEQGIGGIVSTFAPAQSAAAGGAIFGAEAGIASQGALSAAGGAQIAGSFVAPAALAAAALFAAYQMGIIGPGPTSGPVGVADFSPGLGTDLQFGRNAVNRMEFLTADNGGNPEGLRPIAEAIADLIADSADRFSADIADSLRFRVANYASPEPGNSKDRIAGFEVNAFIRGEAEKRIAEGLDQTQAIFEAFNFAVKEAFTFESATLQEIARNTTAETTEDLLADLEFGQNFDTLRDAITDLGGVVDQNTLAQAQNTVALENQAREFADQAVSPILDSLRRAVELFPAIEGTATSAISDTVAMAQAMPAAANDLLIPLAPAIEMDNGSILTQPGYGFSPFSDDWNPDNIRGTITTPSGAFTLRQTGSDDAPGSQNFSVFDEAGNLVESFGTVTEALAEAADVADTFTASLADQVEVIGRTAEEQARYEANLERVGFAIDVAKQSVLTLVDTITGEFEPRVRGVEASAYQTSLAQIDALEDHLNEMNAEITAANEAFPELNRQLIDVTATITEAQAAALSVQQGRFQDRIQGLINTASGNEFLNTVQTILDTRDQVGADAAELGLNVNDTAGELFSAQISSLLDGLTAAQAQLILDAGFGDAALTGAVTDFITAMEGATSAANDNAATLSAGFQARSNSAAGLGVINQINDLLAQRDIDGAAATAAGQDLHSTVGELFNQELFALLSGSSLSTLGALLTNDQITDAQTLGVIRLRLEEEALAVARESQVADMQSLVVEHERLSAAANDNARALRQTAASYLTNANLSPLSPELQLQEARKQFEDAFRLANDADPTDDLSQDAISRLPELSRTLLESSRAYYGSTEGYLADFNRAQDYLNSTALRQESIEQQQLAALEEINASITALGVGAGSAAEAAAASGYNFGTNVAANQRLYNALVAAGLPTPDAFGAGQFTALRQQNPAVDALASAMGFNTGGSFTVAGPAGNDNLLVPLHLTAGEMVSVSREDNMKAVVAELQALRVQTAEVTQINKALLYENSQLRQQNARWAQADMKNARRAEEREAAQPRRAYG